MSTTSSQKSSISPSNSVSLIKLDELSSFGATKQSRLPALIKLNEIDQNQNQSPVASANSMPNFSASQIENTPAPLDPRQQPTASLPANVAMANKENVMMSENNLQDKTPQEQQQEQQQHQQRQQQDKSLGEDDFQVVEMEQVANEQDGADAQPSSHLMGPSLPQHHEQIERSIQALQSSNLQHSHQLGDSLIEMIINLKNENQNLVGALETNNDYVKERLSEFKRVQEESKRREAQFAMEKAEHEHQIRKLQRQNDVLSERLKSMEAKLRDMKVEVSESLNAAHSSQASSLRDGQPNQPMLYPSLGGPESFGNSALNGNNQATTMQVDATSGELYNQGDRRPSSDVQELSSSDSTDDDDDESDGNNHDDDEPAQAAEAGPSRATLRMANMSKDELEKHFDANKAQFYALDDPMKQCDKLEQQLNEIGKRDYEICLLQQQLNIYRQDFRLERMANLEAKIQIEKLKNDIDKLCLDRIQQTSQAQEAATAAAGHASSRHERGVRFYPTGAAENLIGRLGHQLSKKAAKSAAKAAKYAAKQAHREQRAAAAMARAAAYTASHAAAATTPGQQPPAAAAPAAQSDASNLQQQLPGHPYHQHGGHHGHRRHHHGHHSRPRAPGIRSEVMTDLLSTANKAMLTGYKMASTHVNLALDKLSQYEQQQASALEKNKQQQAGASAAAAAGGATTSSASQPSAPMPSID